MVGLEEIAGDLKSTGLLYSEDSYLRRFSAKVLRLVEDEKRNPYVVLDETIFHPKSGGQPSDKGMIFGPNFKF
ncbi:MAG: hypothetical protein ACE5GD_06810 [Candidatus Geothermarchaeales archaeon]